MRQLLRIIHLLKLDTWAILIIVLFAGILRLYHLDTIPGSLNIDETSIGYNAYSFLLTGTDEYGNPLSLVYESFGDWKLIAYPLFAIVPIAVFGLNEFAVRLPSAIAGILQVYLIYKICSLLFNKQRGIALIAAFFFAISPWGIYFSRIAYETNVATAFFLCGVYTFLLGKEKQKSKYFLLTALFFGLCCYIYHSYIISIPLFSIGLFLLFRKQIPRTKTTFIAASLLIILVGIIFFAVSSSSLSKFSHMSVINHGNVLYNRSDVFRTDGALNNPALAMILFNKYSSSFYQVGQNYLLAFSPRFLFDAGGESVMNNLGDFGMFYAIDALFLVMGIAALIYKREKVLPFIAVWIVIAPIPTAITIDAPSSTRLLMILPVLIIVSSYGAYQIGLYCLKRKLLFLPLGILCLAFLWNFLLFLSIYFVHMNYRRAIFQHYGYEQLVELTNSYPNMPVVINGPDNFPYVSFLFYNKYDPRQYQKEVEYYPREDKQFVRVKGFDRYQFVESINHKDLKPNTLYVDKGKPKPEQMAPYTTAGEIKSPNGDTALWYFIK